MKFFKKERIAAERTLGEPEKVRGKMPEK